MEDEEDEEDAVGLEDRSSGRFVLNDRAKGTKRGREEFGRKPVLPALTARAAIWRDIDTLCESSWCELCMCLPSSLCTFTCESEMQRKAQRSS